MNSSINSYDETDNKELHIKMNIYQEMNLVAKVISDFEQLGYVVVNKNGYLLIYPGKDLGSDCICLIYNQGFLQQKFDFNQPIHFPVLGKEVNLSDWGVSPELVSKFEYPFFERLDSFPVINAQY